MKTIHKYKLYVANSQTVMMPIGAKILSAQAQGENICIWAMVETGNSLEPRNIVVHGTGHEVYEGNLRHIGTTQMDDGRLIWHVFEHTSE